MLVKCDLDSKLCVVKGGIRVIWDKMPSDIVSFAVTTGFGVSVLAGIISGVCYVLSQGIHKKRKQNPGREWYCSNCGLYLRSIEGILEGGRVVTCSKCEDRVCKVRCSARNETDGWVCNICSKTPQSWLSTVLRILQPSKVSYTSSAMDTDSLRQLEADLEAMRDREKAEIRDFIERLVNAMLGENVDDACVSKLYKDKQYDSIFERYHQDLSSALTSLGSALHTSIANNSTETQSNFLDISMVEGSDSQLNLNLPVAGQSPCTAHALLKQIIQRVVRDANDLSSLVRPESSIQVPSDDSNRTYEDLLATAIINKVITSCQNNVNLPSSSANSVSSRQSTSSRTRDDKEYFFGEETLDTKWKTTDLDTTSVSSLEEWLNNENNVGNPKYVDKVTLTIKQNIEEVPSSDSDEEDQDDSEYFKNKALINEDDANWFLQKRQFQGTNSPVPVPMLVPDPTGDAKVLIGDKEVDDTSDLSDVASDFGDTETIPGVKTLLVNSKTVIGGKNLIENISMGSDGELSADSGVREEKDFDEFGSNSLIDETAHYVEAINPSKTDITVDDDNLEDASVMSTYSNTEQDTEYTERYASLPRTIVKSESMSKYDREKRKSVLEEDNHRSVQSADEVDQDPSIEFNGNYSKREREKWKHAVKMENNPYSKENIEKRLNRSNSSLSSLFGKDYYIRQSSAPAGGKAKGEGGLPIWPAPRNQDDDDSLTEIHVAKPVILHDDSDEPQIEPKVIPKPTTEQNNGIDTSISEITSDSDNSYNMYDVSNSQVFKKQHANLREDDYFIKNDETTIEEESNENENCIFTNNVEENYSSSEPNVINVDSPKQKVLETKQIYEPPIVILCEPLMRREETKKKVQKPIATPRSTNKKNLDRSVSVPNLTEDSTDGTPTIVKRKRDNTLISKIYMDPNVRKEALAKRDFTPHIENVPTTPTFRASKSLDADSGLFSPTHISSPQTDSLKLKTPLVQSIAFKVEESNDFETQEVQTNMLYSSEESGDFDKVVKYSKTDESEDEEEKASKKGLLHKEKDPMIEELTSKGLVAERLGKFSKSVPNLNVVPKQKFNTVAVEDQNNNNYNSIEISETEEEEIKLSVRDLRKMFEKNDAQNSGVIIHSLTARTLRRGTTNGLKFK